MSVVPDYEAAPEIVAAEYINATQVKIGDQNNEKVVLIFFWTYTHINCLRTLPYLNAWYEKYKDQGLEIIGVHTPEFDFEKKRSNVEEAVERFAIKYPVVLDNEYETWNAYKNRYWPRTYLVNSSGGIAYDHIGEGAYEETERKIQELLRELQSTLSEAKKIPSDIVRPKGVEQVDNTLPLTPEIYFGAARNQLLGNGIRGQLGPQHFGEPGSMSIDHFYLLGDWDIASQYVQSTASEAGIVVKYKASKVFFVCAAEQPVTLRLMRNGKPLGDERGRDVGPDGAVVVEESRLYRLIEDPSGYGEHTLEIEVDKSGLEVYTLTFG